MLLCQYEVGKKAINNGQTVGVVSIDCSIAFDSIDHLIVKQKINGIGIAGANFTI